MALTFVGSATYSATSGALPAHQAGDYIEILAGRGASATAPTVPAGYTKIQVEEEATATIATGVIGWRTATSSSDTSGTWTNASELIIAVYRPSSGYTILPGQVNVGKSTTATVPYSVLSPMADNSSGN